MGMNNGNVFNNIVEHHINSLNSPELDMMEYCSNMMVFEDGSFSEPASSPAPVMMDMKTETINNSEKEMKRMVESGHRIGFRMKSEVEILDDGFKWRKYGKKSVKNSPNPRNYYKCSNEGCVVKKRVERDPKDPCYVITTYDGMHNHLSPSINYNNNIFHNNHNHNQAFSFDDEMPHFVTPNAQRIMQPANFY